MVSKTKQAIEATRNGPGIVTFNDDVNHVEITWRSGVPTTADELVQEHDWVISPLSASRNKLKLIK